MLYFDAGPDPFQEGLARQNINGHIVYIDLHLRPRLATRYDWAAPFNHGHAEACAGCREASVEGGEHHTMTGGKRGVADRRGGLVVALAAGSGAERSCLDAH